jgi:hypothetical protein
MTHGVIDIILEVAMKTWVMPYRTVARRILNYAKEDSW